ncbi:hypothetical protein HZC07_00445 [Candidatus Micrarchaeota archaeon]|nr:hypothetical protein [Candidatus Micrarchaeota archaeon]
MPEMIEKQGTTKPPSGREFARVPVRKFAQIAVLSEIPWRNWMFVLMKTGIPIIRVEDQHAILQVAPRADLLWIDQALTTPPVMEFVRTLRGWGFQGLIVIAYGGKKPPKVEAIHGKIEFIKKPHGVDEISKFLNELSSAEEPKQK